MATERGKHELANQSNKWVYADFGDIWYDVNNDLFGINLICYTEYQHIRASYSGAYTLEKRGHNYRLENAHLNGDTGYFSGAEERYISIRLWEKTGLRWKGEHHIYLPRGTTKKNVRIVSQNPNYTYAFWNHEVSGAFDTPTFSWNKPTANVNVNNSIVGKATINVTNKVFAQGALPASLELEELYCDTKASPTTKRTIGTAFTVTPGTTYYYKYYIKDNHKTSNTYTGSFVAVKPSAPIINSFKTTEITDNSISVSLTASAGSGATISQIRYSKDGGKTWEGTGANKTYTFNNLTENTTYSLMASVKDNYNQTTKSSVVSAKTLVGKFFKLVKNDGSVTTHKAYLINSDGSKIEIKKSMIKLIGG